LNKGRISVHDLIEYEKSLLPSESRLVAGVDEAGRGPLAGPVLAAAVIMPNSTPIEGIFDSKALTQKERERVFLRIVSLAIDIGVGLADPDMIDKINILQATIQAMYAAIENLLVRPDYVLIDAVHIPALDGDGIQQKSVIKGDQKCYSIAAASIVAKVIRDRLMNKLHIKYPSYNFAQNKGYGTKEHLEALVKVGPSPVHRKTFKRVKELC
jgi:ribonuclease HII